MSAPPEEELIRLLKYGTFRAIREFINKNRNVNLHYPRVDLSTPLSTAIDRSDPSILSILIEKVPGCLSSAVTQTCGRTPLMRAAFCARDPEILLILIEKGADIHERDIIGWNCLYHAVIGKRLQNVITLLNCNCKLIESKDNNGRTPLMVSVYLSSPEIFDYLLTSGANMEAVDNYGLCALHLAILRRKRDFVLQLTKRGMNIDLIVDPASGASLQRLAEGIMSDLLPWHSFHEKNY
ncbi:hypothetical protein QAD02_022963 [Eretmocerus hayati]|uniref:Uncharacterized protein n=1 Tax=Eretmocerus hayati TaxID=131215 RepID=A0ACC2PWZ2_9HYME|nr:hypothetical protein QAD02_022963 [Eretmocerus hayati]